MPYQVFYLALADFGEVGKSLMRGGVLKQWSTLHDRVIPGV